MTVRFHRIAAGLIAAAVLALVVPAGRTSAQTAPDAASHTASASTPRVIPGLAILTTLKRRPGISQGMFHAYVRDVHGPLASRLANSDMRQYWHLELIRDNEATWPRTPSIDYTMTEAEAFDHSNPTVYTSEKALKAYFLDPAVGGILMRDEPNIFSETIIYTAPQGQLLEFRAPPPDPTGLSNGEGAVKYLVYFRKRPDIDVSTFRGFLVDRYAPSLAASPGVTTLRLFLLDPPDNNSSTNRLATGVAHFAAPERQYQAAIEVAFTDRAAMAQAFASTAYRATVADQLRMVRQIHAFAVPETTWMVEDGVLTTAGLRGVPAARLITKIGATNQLAPDAVKAMQGDARGARP